MIVRHFADELARNGWGTSNRGALSNDPDPRIWGFSNRRPFSYDPEQSVFHN